MLKKLRVLIIGAGSIAAFFATPGSDKVLTHAHAVCNDDGFELAGFVDTDLEKAQAAVELWGGRAFNNLASAFKQGRIDAAVVATPDKTHYQVLKELADYPMRIVLAEKPLTQTLEEAYRIKEVYDRKGIPVLVNYTRRFMPEFEEICQRIRNGAFGRLLTGGGYYGKGFLHNGSHMVNLLTFLLGDVKQWRVISRIHDFYDHDPSLSVNLNFGYKQWVSLQAVDCRAFSLFELDLVFEQARFRMIDSGFGIEEYRLVEDTVFSGYRRMVKAGEYNTSLGQAMSLAYENIKGHLTDGSPLKCGLDDALRTMELCHEIQRGSV